MLLWYCFDIKTCTSKAIRMVSFGGVWEVHSEKCYPTASNLMVSDTREVLHCTACGSLFKTTIYNCHIAHMYKLCCMLCL